MQGCVVHAAVPQREIMRETSSGEQAELLEPAPSKLPPRSRWSTFPCSRPDFVSKVAPRDALNQLLSLSRQAPPTASLGSASSLTSRVLE